MKEPSIKKFDCYYGNIFLYILAYSNLIWYFSVYLQIKLNQF